jgi:hypothetical protein
MKFTYRNIFILIIILIFTKEFYSQSTACDDCPEPDVVLYGVQMNVPQPPPDDSLGQYNTSQSQQAFLNWIALGDAMVPMAQISSNDPEKDCVQWLYGTMAQELQNNPDTNVIVHQQNYSTGDIPPDGPIGGVDFVIWSTLDSSRGMYHFHVYLEDAYSRTRLATGSADFSDPNNSESAASTAINQILPVFDKIRTYQKNQRNLGGNDIAINAKVSIIPSKENLNGGETIPVEIIVNDCDGTPLSNRWVKLSAVNGSFDKDSVKTDGSGISTANFTADNVKDVGNLTAIYFPYYTTTHKRKGAWGDTTVNIDYVSTRNWVVNINEYHFSTDVTNYNNPPSYGYSNQYIGSKASVTQYVVGDFQDSSISIDYIVGGKGSTTEWGIKTATTNDPTFYEHDTYTLNGVTDPSEDFMYSIGLDDYLQYGEYGGIGFTSSLSLYETRNTHIYMGGSSVSPSPYESDTTLTDDQFPDDYLVYTVGPNDIDGGNNATWNRTDSGFVFKGDFYFDTTITDTYSNEVKHLEEHVVAKVIPYLKLTSVNSPFESVSPRQYKLFQNYPNPFNPTTTIQYQIPKQSHVVLNIYDILGNQVKTLVNKEENSGNYSVNFNASELSSGIYFYRIIAGSFIQTKKLILLK